MSASKSELTRIPLARPVIGSQEIDAVTKVLESGRLALGPYTQKFEQDFAAFLHTKHACAVSSGTSALHLGVRNAQVGPGDEVITSPFSFVASTNAILFERGKPVFGDIDSETFNITPESIQEKITKKTKAILTVDIFGQSADMDPIMELAEDHNLKIIEDACESLGAKYKGKMVGSMGHPATFAFYPNKQITTGEGGMIVCNDPEAHENFTSWRNQGRSANMQWLEHEELGYNYRMNEMEAALGVCQLKRLDSMLAQRQHLAQHYTKLIEKKCKEISPPITASYNTHSWFVYTVLLPEGVDRDAAIDSLNEMNIESKPYLPSIHVQSYVQKLAGSKKGDCPISENTSARSLAIPFYVGISREEQIRVVEALTNVLENTKN